MLLYHLLAYLPAGGLLLLMAWVNHTTNGPDGMLPLALVGTLLMAYLFILCVATGVLPALRGQPFLRHALLNAAVVGGCYLVTVRNWEEALFGLGLGLLSGLATSVAYGATLLIQHVFS